MGLFRKSKNFLRLVMLQEVENKIVRLAERGARVVIASRKIDACEELAAQIRDPGGDAFAVECHVGDWASLDRVVADVTDHWGRLDGPINNAGMSRSR